MFDDRWGSWREEKLVSRNNPSLLNKQERNVGKGEGDAGTSHPQELNRVIISLHASKCPLSPSSAEAATMSSGSFVSLREGHGAPWGVGGRAAGKMTARSKESSHSVVLERRPMQ